MPIAIGMALFLLMKRSMLSQRSLRGRLVVGLAIEEVFGAARFVFILQLRHSLDQRLKLVIGQVWNQWSNSRRQIPS